MNISITAVAGIPLVQPGDDLATLLSDGVSHNFPAPSRKDAIYSTGVDAMPRTAPRAAHELE